MISFAVHDLMDEQKCYEWLLQVFHPDGLQCPRGHALPEDQAPHDRHRTPVVDYRCRICGSVFNIYTETELCRTHYSPAIVVSIFRGIVQGTPTLHLAKELEISRSNLIEFRHHIQHLVLERFTPLLCQPRRWKPMKCTKTLERRAFPI